MDKKGGGKTGTNEGGRNKGEKDDHEEENKNTYMSNNRENMHLLQQDWTSTSRRSLC